MNVLDNEHLAEHAARRGQQILEGLQATLPALWCLREVRGQRPVVRRGVQSPAISDQNSLAIGRPAGLAPFVSPEMGAFLDAFHALHAMHTLMEGHGIYTQFTRSNPLVLRIEPPLTLSDVQVDEFLAAFEKTCARDRLRHVALLRDDRQDEPRQARRFTAHDDLRVGTAGELMPESAQPTT